MKLSNSLAYGELETSIATNAAASQLSAKDIQILQLSSKSDLLLNASQNAANARLDTYQSKDAIAAQLCKAELDAYKHKESLAAQIAQSQL